jgi:chloramphenicol O-acetyltransferase type A
MKKEIDINSWERKDYFNFFSNYEEPFWGIVSNINCSKAYEYCKKNDISFFLYYFYNSLKAVNNIKELRYRIEEDKVVEYSKIHASQTIERDDRSFGFGFFPYFDEFEEFLDYSKNEISQVKAANGLGLDRIDNPLRQDVIHFSVVKWVSFTGLSHARNFKFKESIPKITFGRFFREKNDMFLPVSLHAHHSLADGYHAGLFFRQLEELLSLTK